MDQIDDTQFGPAVRNLAHNANFDRLNLIVYLSDTNKREFSHELIIFIIQHFRTI